MLEDNQHELPLLRLGFSEKTHPRTVNKFILNKQPLYTTMIFFNSVKLRKASGYLSYYVFLLLSYISNEVITKYKP